MKKVLAVLVNYGTDQLQYLEQVINELKSFQKYNVSIIVNSNIPLDIEGVDLINVIQLDNYQLLPMTCRQTIWDHKDDFDVFLFGENDHLFKESHIDKYLEYTSFLPKNRIPGLIQYEENKNDRYYPAYHAHYDWDYSSVEEYKGKKFAHFTNLHQATFILTKKQLNFIGNKINFSTYFKGPHHPQYSSKCLVNTEIYEYCGMKKLICISEFEDNLIHHLPNKYILKYPNKNHTQKMENSIRKMLNS